MADPAVQPVERRGAVRDPVFFPVMLERPGAEPVEAQALNLSATGLLLAASAELVVWSRLTATLPAIGQREVRIVRRDGDNYGCLFGCALDQEEFDAVIASPEAESGFARLRAAAEALPPPTPKRGLLGLWRGKPR